MKFTALDARQIGFETRLILEAVRGVDLRPEDSRMAIEEMRAAGVQIIVRAEPA